MKPLINERRHDARYTIVNENHLQVEHGQPVVTKLRYHCPLRFRIRACVA